MTDQPDQSNPPAPKKHEWKATMMSDTSISMTDKFDKAVLVKTVNGLENIAKLLDDDTRPDMFPPKCPYCSRLATVRDLQVNAWVCADLRHDYTKYDGDGGERLSIGVFTYYGRDEIERVLKMKAFW